MARTTTSRWTSQFIVKVAIAAAAVGCLGPLTFAVVRSGTNEPARTRKVATVGQVSLNSSPAAAQAQTPAERSSEPSTVGSTVPEVTPATSTTLLAVSSSTSSTTAVLTGSSPSQVAVVTVVEADDGKTIVLRQGQRLRIVLQGPTWQFGDPSDAKVLAAQGEPAYTPGENCAALPGTRCGSVKAEFRALKTGAATLTATRAPCGDPSFQCVDEQAKYQLQVTVRT